MAKPVELEISVDLKSLEPIKKLIDAASMWVDEVSKRSKSKAEKALFSAFIELVDNAEQGED